MLRNSVVNTKDPMITVDIVDHQRVVAQCVDWRSVISVIKLLGLRSPLKLVVKRMRRGVLGFDLEFIDDVDEFLWEWDQVHGSNHSQ